MLYCMCCTSTVENASRCDPHHDLGHQPDAMTSEKGEKLPCPGEDERKHDRPLLGALEGGFWPSAFALLSVPLLSRRNFDIAPEMR